jgi:PadR family transcriptional regulator, regulatory protein PadR
MQDDMLTALKAWRSQLLKGSLELAVLLAVRRERRYGLELVEVCRKSGLPVSDGTIYPLLSRLKAEGKVESEWVDRESGHALKYYRISPHGEAICQTLLEGFREHTQAVERLARESP